MIMTFSGYYRWLCPNGHLFHAHALDGSSPIFVWDWYEGASRQEEWECPVCGEAGIFWRELIVDTNGSEEGIETKLEIDQPEIKCTCKECGNVHVVEPARYKIPEKKK